MQSKSIEIYTIGFTQKSAEAFFESLVEHGVKRVIDTRLNNVSQLAGFSKHRDLKYFLWKIAGIDYIHLLDLAPTKDILDEYKKKKGDWSTYEKKFVNLIANREIERKLSTDLLDQSCLLCSEAKPHRCHRRLVAEYLRDHWKSVDIFHL